MTSAPRARTLPAPEDVRVELAAILASSGFKRSGALCRFLAFVCEETLAGRAQRLKEYTIALEALGRPASFQPKEDPVVRVDAIRLRRSLREFYRTEGRHRRIRINLPKGGYVPEFHVLDEEAVAASTPRVTVLPEPEPDSRTEARVPAPRAWPRLLVALGALGIALALLYALAWQHAGGTPAAPSSSAPDERAAGQGLTDDGRVADPDAGAGAVRILAGNTTPRYIDRLGRVWGGDRFFAGGRAEATVFEPIVRVEDRELWRQYRSGDAFEYAIPLAAGVYELRLYFTEPLFGVDELHGGGETARVFDVFANGRRLLNGFDILGDAGGPRTADVKVFTDIAPGADGLLRLRFVSKAAVALVHALELVPGLPGRMRPIRITTRERPFLSKGQVLWGADRYYAGGRLNPLGVPVAGTDEPDLYASERFGNFSYTIPVAPGRYTAVLHFSEGYFGLPGLGQGGAGSRVFDIHCNGVALVKGLDIFKEAGGPARALRREFRGLRANALGKLILTFQPDRNYPCLNALEIVAEAP